MNPEVKWLMDYLDSNDVLPEIQLAIENCCQWACKLHSYESKTKRIREWISTVATTLDDLFYEVVTHVFVGTLLHPEGMTYQAMIGYISGNIKCADPLDRAKCAAEIIALCYQADLIVIEKVSSKTMMVYTEFELPIDIPAFDKHIPLFRKPSEVAYNPILGNGFKQHDGDVCPEHINKMNHIPFVLEERIIDQMEEYQKNEPETDEQREQWEDFKRRSAETYQKVLEQDHFYLEHSYDTRGRTYCSGYYINYQGSQYKKSIVQLADKEVVKL